MLTGWLFAGCNGSSESGMLDLMCAGCVFLDGCFEGWCERMHADYMLCIEGWLGCLVVSWMLVIFRFHMVV